MRFRGCVTPLGPQTEGAWREPQITYFITQHTLHPKGPAKIPNSLLNKHELPTTSLDLLPSEIPDCMGKISGSKMLPITATAASHSYGALSGLKHQPCHRGRGEGAEPCGALREAGDELHCGKYLRLFPQTYPPAWA